MDNDKLNIPYIAYESAQARMERINNRLLRALICLILALFLSNAIWLWAWVQYDYTSATETETVTYSQDGEGYNNINTGFQGGVNNGADIQKKNSQEDANTDKE